jgi:hypothetical protein
VLTLNQDQASKKYGRFEIIAEFDRPSSMANLNTEGFTISNISCSHSLRGSSHSFIDNFEVFVYWADDDNTDGHSIRQGTIPSGNFIEIIQRSSTA